MAWFPSCSKTCWNVFHFFQTPFCVTDEKQCTILKLQSCTFPPVHVLTRLDYFWSKNWRKNCFYIFLHLYLPVLLYDLFSLSFSFLCVIMLRLFKNFHTLCTSLLGQPGLFWCLDPSLGCHSADRSPECRREINPISPVWNNGWTRVDQNMSWKGLI